DVTHGIGRAHVGGALADDDGHLGLALEDRGRHVGQDHGVTGPDDAVGGLVEGVDGRRLRAGAVLHVVHGHRVDVVGLGDRRPHAHAAHRYAAALGDGVLQLAAILAEARDQSADEVVGTD